MLSARIGGKGLELVRVDHVLLDAHVVLEPDDPDHEPTIGRSLGELTSPLAVRTRTALAEDGVEFDLDSRYTQRACYCIFQVAQAA